MHTPISEVADLGLIIRAVRRQSGVRLDDLAVAAGVSKQFVQDVEYGKPTARIGLVLRLLDQLGIKLLAEFPGDSMLEIDKLKEQRRVPRASKSKARPRRKATETAQ